MSVSALFLSSICAILLFLAHKFFAWQSSKYHQVNPFVNTLKRIKMMKISRERGNIVKFMINIHGGMK
ncbi:hypothetical protein MSWHS_0665 [Methanosarcina sp. WWM596]|nr:hypothetical protein MSWHS_0665 [Methanosarcina sp. WWM596]